MQFVFSCAAIVCEREWRTRK